MATGDSPPFQGGRAKLPLSAFCRGFVADPWTQRPEYCHHSPGPCTDPGSQPLCVVPRALGRALGGASEGGLGSVGALAKEGEQEGGRKVPAWNLAEAGRGCLPPSWPDCVF